MCKVNRKELFVKAHKMTKELIKEFPAINYQAQLGICLKQLWEEAKSPQQIATEAPASYNAIEKVVITGVKNSGTQNLHIMPYDIDIKIQAIMHRKNMKNIVAAQAKSIFFQERLGNEMLTFNWNYKTGAFDFNGKILDIEIEEVCYIAILESFKNIGVEFDEEKYVFLMTPIEKSKQEPVKENKPVKQPKKETKKEEEIQVENNVKYISLPEDDGVQCNVFENGYIRGRIDNNWFFWRNGNAKIVLVDEPYVKGKAIGFMEPDRIIARIKKEGFPTIAAAIKEAHYKEVTQAADSHKEYTKLF